MKNSALLETWEETGLLQGLTDEKKLVCAEGFETLWHLLMKEPTHELNLSPYPDIVINTILPVYRRLINKDIFPDPAKLYNHYKNWIKEGIIPFKDLIVCDLEFELIIAYVEFITENQKLIC